MPLPDPPRRRSSVRRLLILGAALALPLAAGAGAWNATPDPFLEAEAFLAPYDEVDCEPPTPSPVGVSTNGTLARRAWLVDEEARLRRMLPASHGWKIRRSTSGPASDLDVRVVASASGPPRLRYWLRKLPFLPAPNPDSDSVLFLELSPARPLARERDPGAPPETVGWTTAAVMTMWRPYPFHLPPTTGTRYEAHTPASPLARAIP